MCLIYVEDVLTFYYILNILLTVPPTCLWGGSLSFFTPRTSLLALLTPAASAASSPHPCPTPAQFRVPFGEESAHRRTSPTNPPLKRRLSEELFDGYLHTDAPPRVAPAIPVSCDLDMETSNDDRNTNAPVDPVPKSSRVASPPSARHCSPVGPDSHRPNGENAAPCNAPVRSASGRRAYCRELLHGRDNALVDPQRAWGLLNSPPTENAKLLTADPSPLVKALLSKGVIFLPLSMKMGLNDAAKKTRKQYRGMGRSYAEGQGDIFDDAIAFKTRVMEYKPPGRTSPIRRCFL